MNAPEFTTDTLLDLIAQAMKALDWDAVIAGLRVLAVQSPRDAEAILETTNLLAAR